MTLEQRVDALERRVTRYRGGTMAMVLVLVAGVTMGQAAKPQSFFDKIYCESIMVGVGGGPKLILLPGLISLMGENGPSVLLGDISEGGFVTVLDGHGRERISIRNTDTGGYLGVSNKTGESIATLSADEYGNGVVGAWNRKGKGRTLKPGP